MSFNGFKGKSEEIFPLLRMKQLEWWHVYKSKILFPRVFLLTTSKLLLLFL